MQHEPSKLCQKRAWRSSELCPALNALAPIVLMVTSKGMALFATKGNQGVDAGDGGCGHAGGIEACDACVQVEHTCTEEVTGVDLVQAQIRIAGGATLADIGIGSQVINCFPLGEKTHPCTGNQRHACAFTAPLTELWCWSQGAEIFASDPAHQRGCRKTWSRRMLTTRVVLESWEQGALCTTMPGSQVTCRACAWTVAAKTVLGCLPSGGHPGAKGVCDSVPHNERGPGAKLPAGQRPHPGVPLARRPRHPPRWRHDRRQFCLAPLRLPPRQGRRALLHDAALHWASVCLFTCNRTVIPALEPNALLDAGVADKTFQAHPECSAIHSASKALQLLPVTDASMWRLVCLRRLAGVGGNSPCAGRPWVWQAQQKEMLSQSALHMCSNVERGNGLCGY